MTCWKPSALLKSHTCTLEHVFPNHMFILTAPTMTGPSTIFCVALECVSVCLSYLKLSLSLWWRETAFFCASSARAQVECVCVFVCVWPSRKKPNETVWILLHYIICKVGLVFAVLQTQSWDLTSCLCWPTLHGNPLCAGLYHIDLSSS